MRGIQHLHPELNPIASEFGSLCKAAGLNVLITETFRTTAEQNALYAQGRTTPGGIVTRAKGDTYQSPHQWGVAFDFCRNVKGREYDDSDGFFGKCGAVGKQLGLRWGGDFKTFVDKPHLELIKYMPKGSTSWLKSQYGTPDKFKLTWEDTMTTAEFEKWMAEYNANLAKQPVSTWAEEAWEKAVKLKIFDGTAPKGTVTREQVAVVLDRLGLFN